MNELHRRTRAYLGKDEDPMVVNQTSLEETAHALRTGDVELMNSWFALPFRLQTYDNVRVMETKADLEKLFEDVRTYYDSAGVTDIHRRCVAASFRGPDEIVATFETRLLHKNSQVIDPYPSLSTSKWIDGQWLITSTNYGIELHNVLSQVLSGIRHDAEGVARQG